MVRQFTVHILIFVVVVQKSTAHGLILLWSDSYCSCLEFAVYGLLVTVVGSIFCTWSVIVHSWIYSTVLGQLVTVVGFYSTILVPLVTVVGF